MYFSELLVFKSNAGERVLPLIVLNKFRRKEAMNPTKSTKHELTPLPQGVLARRVPSPRQAPSALACAVGSFLWVISAAGLDALLGTPLAFVIVLFQSMMLIIITVKYFRKRP